MSTRVRGNRVKAWRRALVVSCGLHGLFLVGVGFWIFTLSVGTGSEPASVVAGRLIGGATDETPTPIDLSAVATIPPLDLASPPATPPVPDLRNAAAGDQTRTISDPAVLARPGVSDTRVPAADRGAGAGRTIEDPAWRRDATTLHERLTDGAETYQPSRAITSGHESSPQAVRLELRTDIGDSPASRQARRSALRASYGRSDPDESGLGAVTREGARATSEPLENLALPEAPRAILASAQGPLDAERGARSFDVETRGTAVADDRDVRAASHEAHPSVTDLSSAAVPGSSAEGRGPSDAPGAVSRAQSGVAPSPVGTRAGRGTSGAQQQAQERRYDRYIREIGSRVNGALIFPRTLLVKLEQGETVLHFVVRPDGRLADAIQIIKSSGFVEFDRAAVDAVRKSLPFPPMPDGGRRGSLGVKLPVTFSNPVIR